MSKNNGKKPPKISVCIPVRNGELWISESIRSIIDQSFNDWEIIVVDDASDDATLEIVQHYYEKLNGKLKYAWFDTQQGIATIRNKANRMAAGEIICVQDADDLSQKDRLKHTWNFLNRHKDIDLVYGGCQYLDAIGKPFGMIDPEPFNFERLKTHNFISHPTVAYRRRAILTVPYRAECRVIDDWFLYLDFYRAGMKISPIPEVLSFYRVLQGSVSNSPEKQKEVDEMKDKYLSEAAHL